MSRIQTVFEQLKLQQRKALIPFITAGDPNPQLTVPLLHALVEAGADILELGVPFSDPMADGPTIQRASERALKHHVGLHHVLDMVAEFRRKNSHTPVVLMGYGNPIEAMGWETFAKRCAEVGVDGVLTVDFPPEESHEAFTHLEAHGIDPIFLLAPTTREERVAQVAKLARGYVYYVSLKGVTGAGNLDLSAIEQKLPQLRRHIKLPIGVGFGIRDGATANAVAKLCDGVVVGSRIVQEIEDSNEQEMVANVGRLVKELRQAIDN
ncbi:MAG: tryptophan synthase subunit alpha [Gallionella sp.]|nr:tryptophan synthase subunit alpha [Gallionella sp.]NCS75220.1 tryptophan synthase subunit alpha [Gallionella sp.]PIR09805.1 MAG: tryptophan synthase subunit alpha [Gallionellaceae bacterium CG11_big_fil_rev_8_21_14_0_20_60_62]